MKESHFLGEKNGTGNPPYFDKMTMWFWFKKVGIGSDHPPLLEQNPKYDRKFFLRASHSTHLTFRFWILLNFFSWPLDIFWQLLLGLTEPWTYLALKALQYYSFSRFKKRGEAGPERRGEVRKLIKSTLCRSNLWLWNDREGANMMAEVKDKISFYKTSGSPAFFIPTFHYFMWDIFVTFCNCLSSLAAAACLKRFLKKNQFQDFGFFYWQKWVPRFDIGAIKSCKSFLSLNMPWIFCVHQFLIFLLEQSLTISQMVEQSNLAVSS